MLCRVISVDLEECFRALNLKGGCCVLKSRVSRNDKDNTELLVLKRTVLPVSAAGLVTVLYWLYVDITLWRGLSGGDTTMASSSMMRRFLGWFLGSSLSRCSRDNFSRSNF